MKRILIIGSNGAGKSTFSYQLAKHTNLPLYHIDQIYWRDNWQVTPKEVFEEQVNAIAKTEAWIIEGNNVRSLSNRLCFADTVFWFEFPPILCIWNILKREWKYHGKARPDMPETCISQLSFSFLKYAWNFNQNNRQRIRTTLNSYPNINIIRFTSYRQIKYFLNNHL